MRVNEIQKQMAEQYSAMNSFPSQRPTLEQMYAGQNQRASIEMQIETAKLLSEQDKKLVKLNEVVHTLYKIIEQQNLVARERAKTEEIRYKRHARLSAIAAWSGVVGVVLAAISIWFK